MDLNVIHSTIIDVFRKQKLDEPAHGIIDEFLDLSQIEVYQDKFNKYGLSDDSHDSLAPFKITVPFTASANGAISYPTDYLNLVSVYVTNYDNKLQRQVDSKVMFVNDDKLLAAKNSQIRPISNKKPIGTSSSTSINVFPASNYYGTLIYFKRPQAPKYAFSLSGRILTYDITNSVQLLWNDVYVNEIIAKTIGYLGLRFSDNDSIQFSQLKQQAK